MVYLRVYPYHCGFYFSFWEINRHSLICSYYPADIYQFVSKYQFDEFLVFGNAIIFPDFTQYKLGSNCNYPKFIRA